MVAIVAVILAVSSCGGGEGDGTMSPASTPSTSPPKSTTTSGETTTSTGADFTTTPGQVGEAPRSVRQTVDVVLMSGDPAEACSGELVTQRYLRVAYGDREGCEKAVSPQSVTKSLGSYEEHVNGDRATVTLRPSDGTYDGDKLTVSLIRDGGNWKVDGLKSNARVGP